MRNEKERIKSLKFNKKQKKKCWADALNEYCFKTCLWKLKLILPFSGCEEARFATQEIFYFTTVQLWLFLFSELAEKKHLGTLSPKNEPNMILSKEDETNKEKPKFVTLFSFSR